MPWEDGGVEGLGSERGPISNGLTSSIAYLTTTLDGGNNADPATVGKRAARCLVAGRA
jgi:hypothetical protein